MLVILSRPSEHYQRNDAVRFHIQPSHSSAMQVWVRPRMKFAPLMTPLLLSALGLHAAAFPRSFFPRSVPKPSFNGHVSRLGLPTPVSAPSPPCVVTIGDNEYDVSAWAPSHPGGEAALRAFHGRNATCAFFRAGHSMRAFDKLTEFVVNAAPQTIVHTAGGVSPLRKLFTKEDPLQLHKGLGAFVLIHYVYRYALALTVDPFAGLVGVGRLCRRQLAMVSMHGALSCSSLIFRTVPRKRVVGQPMIWQEFRAHNIIFAMRSLM